MTAPMTVDAVMALADEFSGAFGGTRIVGDGVEPSEAQPRAALRTAVELLAQQARAKALEDAAKVAAETVCDTHLPTGVRIYGTRAANAIRAMK